MEWEELLETFRTDDGRFEYVDKAEFKRLVETKPADIVINVVYKRHTYAYKPEFKQKAQQIEEEQTKLRPVLEKFRADIKSKAAEIGIHIDERKIVSGTFLPSIPREWGGLVECFGFTIARQLLSQ
jgi:hypothetical protein